MNYPEWLKMPINTDRLKNVINRTTTKSIDIYIVEQDAYNYTRFFADNDSSFPTAMDRILRELAETYQQEIKYPEELLKILKADELSMSDFERLQSFYSSNGIKLYTLEHYILEAFNLYVTTTNAEDSATLIANVYNVILSNPILTYLEQLPLDYRDRYNMYELYNAVTRGILLWVIAKGKSVFPLKPDNLSSASLWKLFREARKSIPEGCPTTILQQLDLILRGEISLKGVMNVHEF